SNLPSTSNRRGNRKRKIDNEQARTEHAETEIEINVCNSMQTNKQTAKVAVQVSNETHEIGVQVSDDMLFTLEARINLLQLQLNSRISEMEDLKKQLEYAYDYIIESCEQLYYIAPEMQAEHELELKIYLSSILEELVAKKNEKINAIDLIIKNQKGTGSQSKWCKKYNTTNIDNKKRTCPKCNEKLDTLAVLRAEFVN
ncbi:15784_t:CDS:2, partial [Dentiscutata heterogama]